MHVINGIPNLEAGKGGWIVWKFPNMATKRPKRN